MYNKYQHLPIFVFTSFFYLFINSSIYLLIQMFMYVFIVTVIHFFSPLYFYNAVIAP